MFGGNYFYWLLGILAVAQIIFAYSNYKTKELPVKQGQIQKLFNTFAAFSLASAVLAFNLVFSDEGDYIPESFSNLDEVQRILKAQQQTIDNFRLTLYFLLISFFFAFLPAIYNLKKTVDIEAEKGKSVLNLSDE